MHVENVNGCVKLHLASYVIRILERFNLQRLARVHMPYISNTTLISKDTHEATAAFKTDYLSNFGSLYCLSTITRPDLPFAVTRCGRINFNPNQTHMDALHRAYAYTAATPDKSIFFDGKDTQLRICRRRRQHVSRH
jgi:hypothetical protein